MFGSSMITHFDLYICYIVCQCRRDSRVIQQKQLLLHFFSEEHIMEEENM